jgi:hypothetical protein
MTPWLIPTTLRAVEDTGYRIGKDGEGSSRGQI